MMKNFAGNFFTIILQLIALLFGYRAKKESNTMEALKQLFDQLASMHGVIEELMKKLSDSQAALEIEKKLSYDQGFADGVASVPVPVPNPDLKYTQEDLDNAVRGAVEPMQIEIAALKSEIEMIPQKIAMAKMEVKAEILAKWEESQLKESEAEGSFGEFLKS